MVDVLLKQTKTFVLEWCKPSSGNLQDTSDVVFSEISVSAENALGVKPMFSTESVPLCLSSLPQKGLQHHCCSDYRRKTIAYVIIGRTSLPVKNRGHSRKGDSYVWSWNARTCHHHVSWSDLFWSRKTSGDRGAIGKGIKSFKRAVTERDEVPRSEKALF